MTDFNPITFNRIKDLVRTKGYTLSSLNEAAGLGKNVIYGWKTKKPEYDNVAKVAIKLGVSTDYLLGKTDEMIPKIEASGLSRKNSDELLNATDGLDQEEMQQLINLARMLNRKKG